MWILYNNLVINDDNDLWGGNLSLLKAMYTCESINQKLVFTHCCIVSRNLCKILQNQNLQHVGVFICCSRTGFYFSNLLRHESRPLTQTKNTQFFCIGSEWEPCQRRFEKYNPVLEQVKSIYHCATLIITSWESLWSQEDLDSITSKNASEYTHSTHLTMWCMKM